MFDMVTIDRELSLHISEFSMAQRTFEEKKFPIVANPENINPYQINVAHFNNTTYVGVESKLYAYDGMVVQEILNDAQNISFDLK